MMTDRDFEWYMHMYEILLPYGWKISRAEDTGVFKFGVTEMFETTDWPAWVSSQIS